MQSKPEYRSFCKDKTAGGLECQNRTSHGQDYCPAHLKRRRRLGLPLQEPSPEERERILWEREYSELEHAERMIAIRDRNHDFD